MKTKEELNALKEEYENMKKKLADLTEDELANLACGRTDVYFEWTLKPWDFAAGMLLVTEAGGQICVPPGESKPDCSASSAILAACVPCFTPALQILKQS